MSKLDLFSTFTSACPAQPAINEPRCAPIENTSCLYLGASRMIRKGAIAIMPRYAVVAGSCLILHNVIMIAADCAGLTMWQAAATSFCILAVIGYLSLCPFVFQDDRSWRGFLRYTGAMAANLPLSTGLLWILFGLLHQPMAVAAPAATAAMVLVNYFASHWAITGKRSSRSSEA